MNDSKALTHGVHHIGLTVDDLDGAVAFFTNALGFTRVGGRPDYPSVFVSDGAVMVTLWKADDGARSFDRRENVGLHHLALKVANPEALARVHERVASHPGVEIEFAPEAIGDGGNEHMMCRIPGGIRLEFFALAA